METQHLVFTNYESFILRYQKRRSLYMLFHTKFSICCDFKTYQLENNNFSTIFRKNNYPEDFIDLCIKSFLNNLYTPKVIVSVVRKHFDSK